MKLKLISILSIFLLSVVSANLSLADSNVVRVTPIQTISTSKKNSISEGEVVKFKICEDIGLLKKGEIVKGFVLEVEPNGFAGKEAQVLIGNFSYNNMHLDGEIYLHGNLHKKLNEFVDGNMAFFPLLFRGGEVVVKPEEQDFLLYIED